MGSPYVTPNGHSSPQFATLEDFYQSLSEREKWLLCNYLAKRSIPDVLSGLGQERLRDLMGARYPEDIKPEVIDEDEQGWRDAHYEALQARQEARDRLDSLRSALWSAERKGGVGVDGIRRKTAEQEQEVNRLRNEIAEAEAAYEDIAVLERQVANRRTGLPRRNGSRFPLIGRILGDREEVSSGGNKNTPANKR